MTFLPLSCIGSCIGSMHHWCTRENVAVSDGIAHSAVHMLADSEQSQCHAWNVVFRAGKFD